MAITLVQGAGSNQTAATPVIATGSTVTSGNLLLLTNHERAAATTPLAAPTVTINGVSQTVLFADSVPNPLINGSVGQLGLWYLVASATGACSITYGQSVQGITAYAEYAGIPNPVLDQHLALNQTVGSTAFSNGPTGTTVAPAELVYAHFSVNGSSTTTLVAGSGYTQAFTPVVNSNGDVICEHKIVAVTGTQTATATSGASKVYESVMATFYAGPVAESRVILQAVNRSSTY